MTNDLEKELLEYVKQRVRKEFKANGHHRCRFDDVDEADAKVLIHAVESFKRLGNGSLSKTFSLMEENHRWVEKQRCKMTMVHRYALIITVTTVFGALLSAVWIGIKQLAAQ